MHSLPADPSFLLNFGFCALPVLMIVLLAYLTRSWATLLIGMVWATLVGALALTGWLADFSGLPPRAAFILIPTFVLTVVASYSRFGRPFVQLSVALLVGLQSFRIIVELLIHRAVVEGVAPPQLSWSGQNFDIVTGVTALVLILFVERCPRAFLLAWNTMGLALVLWVVGVAILSLPTPFQRFTPDNVWIAYFPFIWLPTILVAIAIFLHLVLYRKLMTRTRTSTATSAD